jgi:hypothetical protein
MLLRWAILLLLLSVGFVTASCQKIESESTGPLKVEPVSFDNAIPREYGKLVSVTAEAPKTYVFWFVKPDETIVGIAVDGKRLTLSQKSLTIPRR